MTLQLDLQKSAGALKLTLEKKGIITPPSVDIAFALDVSGSYDDEHRDGVTTDLLARFVPWGMLLDPDKKMEVLTFSSGRSGVHYVGEINGSNYQGYVRNNIIDRVPGYGQGTDYAPVIERSLELFGWEQPAAQTAQKSGGGFLGFGKKPSAPAPTPGAAPRKTLILFNTDGANGDEAATDALFQRMQDKGYQVYVQFIAVSNQGASSFRFIQRLADKYANCGITTITDIKRWVAQDDAAINEAVIGEEMVAWLKAA